ncbi:MAG: helix-turn-helix domain-containing protein [Merdibacter sp.]
MITCILKHPKGIYAATIAEELRVSDRTVRNDIASINMVLINSQCMIQSSKRTGYFIMQENISRIRECLSLMDAVDETDRFDTDGTQILYVGTAV